MFFQTDGHYDLIRSFAGRPVRVGNVAFGMRLDTKINRREVSTIKECPRPQVRVHRVALDMSL